jgi:tripartite-type tricarboxylate transporter receptor subunit TctC
MGRFLFLAVMAMMAVVQGPVRVHAQQSYPARTVRIIVPFGAASATDITARLFADRLSTRWGKPVVIENRPGGDGIVAITTFIGANDDHVLLFGPAGTFTVHPYEHDTLPYDGQRDLLPIVGVVVNELAISVPTSLNINSLGELVAMAQAQPGKLNEAASSGSADFLISGFIKNMALQITDVPYRDIMQAPNDLAEGRIQLLASSLQIVRPLAAAGRIKILAVTSRQRAPTAPDIPTVIEAGYPALTFESIGGAYGPRGMSLELREKIAADFRAVSDDPVIASRLGDTGQILSIRGPAEFAADIQGQRDQLAAIAKVLGLKAAQ